MADDSFYMKQALAEAARAAEKRRGSGGSRGGLS